MGLFDDVKRGLEDFAKEAVDEAERDKKDANKRKNSWSTWFQDNGPVVAGVTAGVLILIIILGKALK
jgi:hypothetical protein